MTAVTLILQGPARIACPESLRLALDISSMGALPLNTLYLSHYMI